MSVVRFGSIAALALLAITAGAAPAPVVQVGRTSVHICTDNILRVVHTPTDAMPDRVSLIARKDWGDATKFQKTETASTVSVTTSAVRADVDKASGKVTFTTPDGKTTVLAEKASVFTPLQDLTKKTYTVEQQWEAIEGESIYGGGEYQNGILDFKNAMVQMVQFNTEAVVPFFSSTAGYGLLWDNYAWSFLNAADPTSALTFGGDGKATFTAHEDGVHHFYVDACSKSFSASPTPGGFGCGSGKTVNLTVAGQEDAPVVNWDQLTNMPNSLTGRAELEAGKTYTLSLSVVGFGTTLPPVYVNTPAYGKTSLKSSVGDLIDYYFVRAVDTNNNKNNVNAVEANLDAAVAGYRTITGVAPLYARWVYGFWQCKEHYDTQAHLLEAAHGYRNRSIPVDAIVQDWHYWGNLGWGPQWDPAVYPDPQAMVKELHEELDMHLMVSVWSKFDAKTSMFKNMTASGFMLNGTQYYDAWNADARERFYSFSKKAMFDIGVDALWLDATEPEGFPNVAHETALGSGDAVMNTYSLMTTKAISDGLRRDFPKAQGARVFSLTRSSFAAQQTTGAALWSGDISGKWDSLRRQVAASLNYAASGIPYWSEDIGGFFRPSDQYTSEDYHALLLRWFQFGAFTPIYRVHGGGSNTEPWNYCKTTTDAEADAEAEAACPVMDITNATHNLRYRLLPYIYSGFHRVETEGYTMQRLLAFDFAHDKSVAADVADAFMFGPALLVAPIVTQADNTAGKRSLTLPASSGWVNFWSGDVVEPAAAAAAAAAGAAEGSVSLDAPLEHSPLLVRAGAVLPLGPMVQHTGVASDVIELRLFPAAMGAGQSPGESGHFTLYEDDGVSNAHRTDGDKGSASIAIDWDAKHGDLHIAARQGSFPGMLADRIFHVVCVGASAGHGAGLAPTASPDHVVKYSGAAVDMAGVCKKQVVA